MVLITLGGGTVEQTTVEEQLKDEIDRLNERLRVLTKENTGLKKKNGHQKRVMSRQRKTIEQLRRKISSGEDKQYYINVQRGEASKRRSNRG